MKTLNLKTHYSILQSPTRPDHLEEMQFAVCDIGNISGSVKLSKIDGARIGCELKIQDTENRILIFARNHEGWKTLVKLTSIANNQDNFNNEPEIPDCEVREYHSSNVIYVYLYQEDNPAPSSFYGIDFNSDTGSEMARYVRDNNLPGVCVHSCYISSKSKLEDLKLVKCIDKNEHYQTISNKYSSLFSKTLHPITDAEAIELGYTQEEIDNTELIYSKLEKLELRRNTFFPKFSENSIELITRLAKQGLRDKNLHINQEYVERLDYELEMFCGLGLQDYFLILWDIMNFVRSKAGFTSSGRGSAAGCLLSYCLNITAIDPIKYKLMLSRFYNAGRMTKDRTSPPDIDVDVPAELREQTIEYIREKYGRDRVGQIITYTTIGGPSAIKAVFRAYGEVSFEEINRITKLFPMKARVEDKMKEMEEESLIRYCLETDHETYTEYAYLDQYGEIVGSYGKAFDKAVQLEKTKSAASKHAAGIVIGPEPLENLCPMVYDPKTKTTVCGLEMDDLEEVGLLKLDLLGLRALDKIIDICGDIDVSTVSYCTN